LISPTLLPSAQQVGDVIAAYNATIAQVVRQEGATLVDLSASGALIAQHPDWISADGFHPNGLGYLAIARAFEAAYHKAG
jgi:lysophospholipase L1-like esterase